MYYDAYELFVEHKLKNFHPWIIYQEDETSYFWNLVVSPFLDENFMANVQEGLDKHH